MKVAVPAEGPDLSAKVADRLGLCSHVLFVDLDSGEVNVVEGPREAGTGTGMQVVALVIARKSDAILLKWCSPVAEKYLLAGGVSLFTGVDGTVEEALKVFEAHSRRGPEERRERTSGVGAGCVKPSLFRSVRSAAVQIRNLLPVVLGVVLLIGLLGTFVPETFLTALFSGSAWRDSFLGAAIGSVLAGNPVNSYLIGKELLEGGVGFVAVSAFICAWVSVGLVQLPAEVAALGWRFAVIRNVCSFFLSVAAAFAVGLTLGLLGVQPG